MKLREKIDFNDNKVSISTLMLEPLPNYNDDENIAKKVYSKRHNGNIKVLPFYKNITRLV